MILSMNKESFFFFFGSRILLFRFAFGGLLSLYLRNMLKNVYIGRFRSIEKLGF